MKHYKHLILETNKLIPYANNSRTHSEHQVKQIASSIKEFGFTNPILIDDDDGIIAGHGRVMAAELLNINEVPCVRVSGLTNAQKKALVIADNQLALNANWDVELLRLEIDSLREMDFNVDLLGFNDLSFLDEEIEMPDDFDDVDEQELNHTCPKCGYEFD